MSFQTLKIRRFSLQKQKQKQYCECHHHGYPRRRRRQRRHLRRRRRHHHRWRFCALFNEAQKPSSVLSVPIEAEAVVEVDWHRHHLEIINGQFLIKNFTRSSNQRPDEMRAAYLEKRS